ncbi:ArsR/SmtB family transcription factor [Nonomuraea sp. NPDC050556]|uniref:ArsR/SmtB family transcription factor n=1 Tax=Nonomuraea sp. NPDC050556 TaxID=3364369 RepID=UPI00379B02F4
MSNVREPLSDPKAMRALAHPARLAMINRLSVEGSATATQLAEAVGVTPSAASYHLRMLAKYGFVEDAPSSGDGRERVWRAVKGGITVSTEVGEPLEVRAAKDLLIDAVWKDAAEEARRARFAQEQEPEDWRTATKMSRTMLLLTGEEMRVLGEEIEKLTARYRATDRDKSQLPEGARVAEAQVYLFPRAERPAPGIPTEDHDA